MMRDPKNLSDEEIVEKVRAISLPSDQISFLAEMMRRLRNSIDEFNKQSTLWSRRICRLTVLIAILTFIMVVAVGFQIWKVLK